jgi:hypothetical protein
MTMRPLFALLALAIPASAADDRAIVVTTAKSHPPIESVSMYRSADIQPGKAKPKPLKVIKFEKGQTEARFVVSEEVHLFVKPKDGVEVLIGEKLLPKPGDPHTLKLAELLGVIEVFQKDGFAKVDRIVLTAPDDSGPDEKEHVAIQTGSDYRVEMPVPEGFYSVWLVPANGTRAVRIEDRVRVLPGKIVRIGN